MAKKKDSASIEKAEETFGDLDGDNEKGEAPAHQKKVASADKKNAMAKEKNPGIGGGKLSPNPSIPASKTLPKKGTNMPPIKKSIPPVVAVPAKGKKPPFPGGDAPFPPKKGKGKKSNKSMCADCVKGGMSSCSH